jgi:hypothetical protein
MPYRFEAEPQVSGIEKTAYHYLDMNLAQEGDDLLPPFLSRKCELRLAPSMPPGTLAASFRMHLPSWMITEYGSQKTPPSSQSGTSSAIEYRLRVEVFRGRWKVSDR